MLNFKEHLIDYFIAGHLHLSKKDYGFFSNLKHIVQDSKQITTNQTKLFDKLLSKYKRQFNKQGYQVEELISLPWKVNVVESKKEYLEARIFVSDDKLCFKLPFNNLFIKHFKTFYNNPFVWNKTYKRYESSFSTYAIKIALTSLQKFYKEIVFDENVKKIFSELDYFKDSKVWSPTLVKSNQNFYIAGINEALLENVKNLPLSDDPIILFELSQYGIKIDDSVIQEDNFKKFASSYYVTSDLDDLSKTLMYLKILNVNQVTLASEMLYSKEISKEVKQKIHDAGIECYPPYIQSTNDSVLLQYSRNALNVKKTKNILKCITLTNSRPVNVR